MNDPADFETLSALLSSSLRAEDLTPMQRNEITLRGAVHALQADGSAGAIQALAESILANSSALASELALAALDTLAERGNADATAALYRLALLNDCQPAIQSILRNSLPSPTLDQAALLALFTGRTSDLYNLDPALERVTQQFLAAETPILRERIRKAAGRAGLSNLQILLTALDEFTPYSLNDLQERFSDFTPQERSLTVRQLAASADSIPLARETLAILYLRYEDDQAGTIALANGYTPQDPAERALFYFLTSQWKAYETLDFNHRLLVAAYENADIRTRKRLLDLSRRSGQVEWMQSLAGSHSARWLNDLSDADYQNAITRLQTSARWDELWRLAQAASPVWSVYILSLLADSPWQPADEVDNPAREQLVNLAYAAAAAPLSIRARKAFHLSSMDEFTCLALSPDGRFLATGGVSNAIHIWVLDANPHEHSILFGSVPQTRALLFSPDGDYLAAAVADHSIKVYSWRDGKLAKSLDGHSALVRSLAITPDGHTLYSASFDGSIRAWRFPFGPYIKTIAKSEGEIFGIALGSGAATLAAAGADTDIAVYQLPAGNLLHTLSGHQATVTNLVTAPESDLAASYSRDRTIRVWNTLSARQLSSVEALPDVLSALCIHPANELLIAGSLQGTIRIFNLNSGKSLYEIPAHRKALIGLALTPGGESLISSSADGSVTIWNLSMHLLTHQPLENLVPGQLAEIEKLRADPSTSAAETAWLDFIIALLRWKQRFDVQIDSPHTISVGDFDIQLGE